MSNYKQLTQDEKYQELENAAYMEHLNDIWTTFFKLKKYNMFTTGSAVVDKEVYRVCGPWFPVGKVKEGMKKGIQQLREKNGPTEEIQELEDYIKNCFFEYYL